MHIKWADLVSERFILIFTYDKLLNSRKNRTWLLVTLNSSEWIFSVLDIVTQDLRGSAPRHSFDWGYIFTVFSRASSVMVLYIKETMHARYSCMRFNFENLISELSTIIRFCTLLKVRMLRLSNKTHCVLHQLQMEGGIWYNIHSTDSFSSKEFEDLIFLLGYDYNTFISVWVMYVGHLRCYSTYSKLSFLYNWHLPYPASTPKFLLSSHNRHL